MHIVDCILLAWLINVCFVWWVPGLEVLLLGVLLLAPGQLSWCLGCLLLMGAWRASAGALVELLPPEHPLEAPQAPLHCSMAH